MSPDELRERILRWEGPHTEFKESLPRNLDLAERLVCFANSDGGQIIIGVAKDRAVVGVEDTDALMMDVDKAAFNSCAPPVTVVPETVVLDGRQVVVLNVAKGDQRPYATRSGQYYVRSGARCRQASREELLRLFQASHALFYDEQVMPRFDLTDLDLDAVVRYANDTGREDTGEDLRRLLHAWRLIDGDSPTVGGMLLFGRRPQAALESARVVVGATVGDDISGDFIDRKDLDGGLFDLVAGIASFLNVHLRTALHRDYTIPGPTRIFVLSDRVEVRSPGRPPNSVDAEAMRAGVHVTRNPHIYSRSPTCSSRRVPAVASVVSHGCSESIPAPVWALRSAMPRSCSPCPGTESRRTDRMTMGGEQPDPTTRSRAELSIIMCAPRQPATTCGSASMLFSAAGGRSWRGGRDTPAHVAGPIVRCSR